MDTKNYLLARLLALAIAAVGCQRLGAEDLIEPPAAVQVKRFGLGVDKFRVEIEIFGSARVTNQVHGIDLLVYDAEKESGQQHVEAMLRQKVNLLSSEHGLTGAQEAKLMLAGKAEARRLYYEADEIRRQFDSARENRNAIQTLQQEARSLRKKRFALFETNSLLAKVASRVITDEQVAKREAALHERLRLRHRSNIEGAIRDIERRVVLQIPQHEALVELMIAEVPPPQLQVDYEEAIVRYQLARLPESQIKSLFNEDQWNVVRQCLNDFSQVGSQLETEGKIPSFVTRSVTTNEDDIQEKPPADATRPEKPNPGIGL